MKKTRFLISSLLAAGIAPAPPADAHSHATVSPGASGPDPDDNVMVQRFAQDHLFHLAQHRSHSSHASHSSHRSGTSGRTRTPTYVPPPPRTPRATPTPAPRNERSNPRSSILPSSPATAPQSFYSPPSAVSPSGSEIQNVVRQVQIGLKSYGYYNGSIDGLVGPMTRSALKRFQSDFGLKVTGTITPEVLDAFKIVGK
ncbi:MAG: His-Xaa-Ser repeat protein HxsA [Rhodobacteraceae bacterium]|nr:His-Xaa-Ser repeat protein HxsA [Paracoccaceae bacterium]